MDNTDRINIRFGVILSYLSMIFSFLGTLFITNRVLDYIGDYNYGLYTFVSSITAWLSIASSALNASFLRFTSIEASEKQGRIGRTNTIYYKLFLIIGGSILFIGLLLISVLYFNKICLVNYLWEESKTMYLLFAFSIINISISTSFTVFTLFVNYNKKFIFERLVSIAIIILNYLGHFFIAFFTRNIIYISAYTIFVTCVNVLCHYAFSKYSLNISFDHVLLKNNKPLLKQICMFSGILIINSIVDQINSNVDKTLLGIYSIPEKITVYQMGMQFNSYLGVMVVAISSVFAPTINSLVVNNNKAEIDGLFLRVSRLQAIVVCFISFGFVACGKDFIVMWIGNNRVDAYYVGTILMLLNIMPLSVKTSIDIQRAMNKHYFRSGLYFAVAIMNVGLSIFFLQVFPQNYSIFACLLGTVISSVITQWTVMNVYNFKVIKLPIFDLIKRVFLCIVYGAISAAIVIIARRTVLSSISSILLCFFIEMTLFIFIFSIFMLVFERGFLLGFLRRKKIDM